jgi:hypothetical protein
VPRGVIAIEYGQLDVHKHEIRVFRCCLGDALSATIQGLDGKHIAQDGAQILLVFDDKHPLAHATPMAAAARTGSSMRNVEP